ncbi:MAG: aldose epimerase family protein [Candidatus Coprenecus sp.]|nr:aldose epimerase family protein [Candidatus Coprenecus sp.]
MIHLVNKSGARVILTPIGAGVVSVIVPDKNGVMGDVVLGYRDSESYIGDGPCSGKIPGRYANRIAGGRFILDGKEYSLEINNGPNHLHGGSNSYANREWTIEQQSENSVTFTLYSPDNDQSYPGDLNISARYTWSDDQTLSLEIKATTQSATILNLTNHTYWNLRGEDSGTILDHLLKLNASSWLPTDQTLIPTGEIAPVEGTPMDFRKEKRIGEDIEKDFPALKYGKGYDNCWVIDRKDDSLACAAVLSDPVSGRCLEVWTTQKGVQVYTGNWLSGSPVSKSGRSYNDYEGVAILFSALFQTANQNQAYNAVRG